MTEKFPIKLVFKFFALAQQLYVSDKDKNEIFYVYQRFWKVKEKIDVYSNRKRENKLYEINADRILDFSPVFNFTDNNGQKVGSIKRYGMKSILKSYYELRDKDDRVIYTIVETNPIIKFIDGVLNDIPILGMFLGLFLHPKFSVQDANSKVEVARISKSRSLAERIFEANLTDQKISAEDENIISLSMILIALMERYRG